MVCQVVDHLLQLLIVKFTLLAASVPLIFIVGSNELRRHKAARHVLPDQDPETVAVIVVTCRFDLDVFSQRVEAGRFQILEFMDHRGI